MNKLYDYELMEKGNWYDYKQYEYHLPSDKKNGKKTKWLVEAVFLNGQNTLLDFSEPFTGNSGVALIGVGASFCAILILLIFRISKKIEEKMNDNV